MSVNGVSKRRLFIRAGIVVALVAIAFWMHEIGKEHSVLIDNETVTIGGTEFIGVQHAAVFVDGEETKPISFEFDDRQIAKMVGRNHKLRIDVLAEDETTVTKTIEKSIRIDFDTERLMLSLPALVAGSANITIPNPVHDE